MADGYLPADAAARYREVYPEPEVHVEAYERAKPPPPLRDENAVVCVRQVSGGLALNQQGVAPGTKLLKDVDVVKQNPDCFVPEGLSRANEDARGVRRSRVIAGEGMLVATADGSYTDEFGERQTIKAGITRVVPDHPLARSRPEAFKVCCRNDVETAELHRGNLRARMDELRGGTTPAATTARPAWFIG